MPTPASLPNSEPSSVRYALITNGNTKLGAAIADQFASDGFNLVLVMNPAADCRHLAESMRFRGAKEVITIARDITESSAPHDIVEELERRRIVLDALVNTISYSKAPVDESLVDTASCDTAEASDLLKIQQSIDAHSVLSHLLITRMIEVKRGRILNVSSVEQSAGESTPGFHHASNAYVVSFSEGLAEELKDSDIHVACLCPDLSVSRKAVSKAASLGEGGLSPIEYVASVGYKAFQDGERICFVGRPNRVLTFIRRMRLPKTARRTSSVVPINRGRVTNLGYSGARPSVGPIPGTSMIRTHLE